MVISPVRGPVACGVKVTWIVQLAPGATEAFTQLSVSLKSPLIEIDEGERAMLPVFFTDNESALLAVPKTWFGNESVAGFAAAEVSVVPALHSGDCQIPRPYVPATSTCGETPEGDTLRATAGASGSPVPKADQQ